MKDVLVSDFDLVISNGDFEVDNSQAQSVEILLISSQGEWKEYPEAGADIISAKNGMIDRFMDRKIRVQLEADGFKIQELNINEKGINLNGEYSDI